jgi:hypothetical protein
MFSLIMVISISPCVAHLLLVNHAYRHLSDCGTGSDFEFQLGAGLVGHLLGLADDDAGSLNLTIL